MPSETTVLMSGFDLRLVELPPGATLLQAAPPREPLADFPRALTEALEHPAAGPALAERLTPDARVTIAIDDFGYPVPPAQADPRRQMLEAVLAVLARRRVSPSRILVLVLTGLSRKWRPAELIELLGERAVAIACHDAEASSELVRVGELDGAPVEVNRALVDTDLLVYLSVVATPLHTGLGALAAGASGYRTARALNAPALYLDEAPLAAGSRRQALHERVGQLIAARVPVLRIPVVLDNALLGKLSALLQPGPALSRPLQVWNAIPAVVRHRSARFLRAGFSPLAVFAGPPEAVEAPAREAFEAQHEAPGPGGADVLVFGVPGVGPDTVGTGQNPILAASLGLGQIAQLFRGPPLLRPGGVVILCHPLSPEFDRAHAPHQELYDKVLRLEREPEAIHDRFEAYFSGRPEFVSNYQRRFGFHGTHPLWSWYQTTPTRRRAGRIIAAYGDPRACARLGFMPALDLEDALARAREFLGGAPKVAFLQLPPAFWVRTAAAG